MYRTAHVLQSPVPLPTSRPRSLKGCVDNLGTTRFTSIVFTRSSSSVRLFSCPTGEWSSSVPPLDFTLAGVSLPPVSDYIELKNTNTTLPNGVEIKGETSSNSVGSIGLYDVECGSTYETPISCGAMDWLEQMARIEKEKVAVEGNVTSSWEETTNTFKALKTNIPEMIDFLLDYEKYPVFLDYGVNEQVQTVKEEIAELSKDPRDLLLEAIHSSYASAMANSLWIPKATKFRKQHRGRMKGSSNRGNHVCFGKYGLQALEPSWITSRQIEAGRRAMVRHARRGGKIWVRIFPDKSVTMRAAETRMGSGKGSPEFWVAVVKPGRIIYEMGGVAEDVARKAMAVAASKMPIQTKFIVRDKDAEPKERNL